jgi:ATP-binding cassette subfamily B multidrug efflux pump
MRRLLALYLKPYRKSIAVIVALFMVQAAAFLYLPSLNAKLINNGVVAGDTGYIGKMGGFMLLVALLQSISGIGTTYLGARTAMDFGRDVRGALFRKVEGFSQGELDRFGAPSLITRNTNDVQQVQTMVNVALSLMVFAPIMVFGGVIMALREDARLSALLAVIIPVMVFVVALVIWWAVPLYRSLQKKIDRLNRVVREILSGVRVIRAFARGDHEQRRFEQANRELLHVGLRVMRVFAVMSPALWAILNFSSVAIMWFGGRRVDSGAMSIGGLTAFSLYVGEIFIAILLVTMLASSIPRAAASATRIQEVLDVEPAIRDPENARGTGGPADGRWGFLELSDVEFRYQGAAEAVLTKISFTARPGQTTAIVGSTGSGKSTLISLIPRLHDVTSGSITIDGVDIRHLKQADLWKHLGFVPQNAFLFSGTVASNLRYGDRAATEGDLWHALSIAQGRDFVEAMPQGLNEPITQGGTNVSGGQRQRLAIARALVKKADIYVFDDSLSSLDFKTDSMLRAALRREVANATILVVAQRVTSIMHADQIIVLDEGTIVGKGTHEELLKTCRTYQEVVYSQLTAETTA